MNCSLGRYTCQCRDDRCAIFRAQIPFHRRVFALESYICVWIEDSNVHLLTFFQLTIEFEHYLVSIDSSKRCCVFWIFHFMSIGVSPWTLHWTCTCFPLAMEICLFLVVKWAGTVITDFFHFAHQHFNDKMLSLTINFKENDFAHAGADIILRFAQKMSLSVFGDFLEV